jgi:acyl dehydratase
MAARYFEDFQVGQKSGSGTVTVTADGIKAFAREFDPQPFHLDEEAARHTFFGGLVASGWHTAAMTMRLFVDSEMLPAGGAIGSGGSDITWPRPVRPGDVLRLESEVIELRPSRSRPDVGVMKLRLTTYNQAGQAVQTGSPTLIVPRRPRENGGRDGRG